MTITEEDMKILEQKIRLAEADLELCFRCAEKEYVRNKLREIKEELYNLYYRKVNQ